MICLCRFCGKRYEEHKATCDWKGYCSQRCLHAMARSRGYRPSYEKKYGPTYSEYGILNRLNQIGSVKAD